MSEYSNKIPFSADADKYIYVSYSHSDKEIIYPILKELYESGWPIWYDAGIEIDENRKAVIEYRIGLCKQYLLFISIHSKEEINTINYELIVAQNMGKPVAICTLADFDGDTDFASLTYAIASHKKYPRLKTEELKSYLSNQNIVQKGPERNAQSITIGSSEDSRYEYTDECFDYEMCEDGVVLTKYLGKNIPNQLRIPREYPLGSGNPVVELRDTFNHCFDYKTPDSLIIPDSVQRIRRQTFWGIMLPWNITIPNSIELMEEKSIGMDSECGLEIDPMDRIIHITCAPEKKYSNMISSATYGMNIHFEYDISMSVIQKSNLAFASNGNYAICLYHPEARNEMIPLISFLRDNSCNVVDCEEVSVNDLRRYIRKCGCFIFNISKSFYESDYYDYFTLAAAYDKNCIPIEDLDVHYELKLLTKYLPYGKAINKDDSDLKPKLLYWVTKNGCSNFVNNSDCFTYSADIYEHGVTLIRYTGEARKVYLGYEYNGKRIIKIGKEAFSYCLNVEEIILPSGLEAIESRAFENCSKLKELYIPRSVKEIADDAFVGCNELKIIRNI